MTGRVLGLDPGERRIGVALSDPLGMIAQPYSVIDRREQDVATELRRIVVEEEVVEIVIGLPVSMDGVERAAAGVAREFGAYVGEATGLTPHYVDERLTSAIAEQTLIEGGVRREERRKVRDKVAASIMLQSHLDSKGRRHGPA